MTTVTESPVRTDAQKENPGSAFALSHLDALEAESVHVFREVAGEFERPVILFS
ncbi:sulfate adenylyltransferase small subunit, partial [Kitasatospora sp. NPDC005856]